MAAVGVAGNKFPDQTAEIVRSRFKLFLTDFSSDEFKGDSETEDFKDYIEQIITMKVSDISTLFVDYQQLMQYDEPLSSTISEDYVRFEVALKQGLHEVIKERYPEYVNDDSGKPKEFFVAFYNMPEVSRIRDMKMPSIGTLGAINGTVTRTTDVRPELMYGRFICKECGANVGPIEQQFKYTEPTVCSNEGCQNRSKWALNVRESKFVDWQRVRVQENADEIPAGSMPRSVDVILRNSACDKAKPGDKCTFVGTLVVVPDVGQLYKQGSVQTAMSRPPRGVAGRGSGEGVTGLKALGAKDLTYRTAFLAHTVKRANNSVINSSEEETAEAEAAVGLSDDQKQSYDELAESGKVYAEIVRSMGPTIHGLTDVKKGVALMLMGGVHKRTPEGIKLRGDINVCIVGDPSTAKSQVLKYVHKFQPRSVYTSGKASSAAGLTASVVKDPDTGEFTIEAGALMLADNSICCIDEFDKMDPADQVAIHEAMEQQTISISKAGIQATLNARTSILAAANPIMGIYDPTKTLRQNVAISPPIMSRFDLFFVVCDNPDETADRRTATHIVNVHQKREEALRGRDGEDDPLPMDVLQGYVQYARTINPQMTPAAQEAVIKAYIALRQDDSLGANKASYRITVRQLESLIRLSEALARLHLDTEVREKYVTEAYGLLRKSIIKVVDSDIELGEEEKAMNKLSEISTPQRKNRARRLGLDEDDEMEGGAGDDGAEQQQDGQAGHGGDEEDEENEDGGDGKKPKAPTKISAEKFRRMEKVFLLRLQQQEAAATAQLLDDDERRDGFGEDGSPASPGSRELAMTSRKLKPEDRSVTHNDLIAWYISCFVEEQVNVDQKMLKAERKLAKKVLRKLIKTDVLTYTVDYDDVAEAVADEDKLICLGRG